MNELHNFQALRRTDAIEAPDDIGPFGIAEIGRRIAEGVGLQG